MTEKGTRDVMKYISFKEELRTFNPHKTDQMYQRSGSKKTISLFTNMTYVTELCAYQQGQKMIKSLTFVKS